MLSSAVSRFSFLVRSQARLWSLLIHKTCSRKWLHGCLRESVWYSHHNSSRDFIWAVGDVARKQAAYFKNQGSKQQHLDVSIFTATGEFYRIFFSSAGPPARPPASSNIPLRWRHWQFYSPQASHVSKRCFQKTQGKQQTNITRLEKGRAGPDRTCLAESYGQGGDFIWPGVKPTVLTNSHIFTLGRCRRQIRERRSGHWIYSFDGQLSTAEFPLWSRDFGC